MNVRYVLKQFGLLLLVLSATLLGLAAVFFLTEWILHHAVNPDARRALFISGLLGGLGGGTLWLATRHAKPQLGRREALLLVALTWLLGAAFAGVPYFLWARLQFDAAADHPFGSFVDCYFEGMSGLTTTGATVLSDIEAVPRSLLLWRAFTQWLGGLGIVVLFVAVLPTLGVGGKRLFMVEAPGPAPEGLQPQVRQTARVLLLIYLILTGAEIFALWAFTPASFYESICHTFATLATGGFSTRNGSIADFESVTMEVIIIVFIVLAGVNFGLYYQLARRRLRQIWQHTEFRLYLAILAVASLIVVVGLLEERIVSAAGPASEPSVGAAIRHGVFQVVSIQTGTGFVTADFDRWGFVPKAILVVLMFVGACAGSTSGGLKVIRVWLVFKVMLAEIERIFRPSVIRPVRIGNAVVDGDLKLGAVIYVLGIGLLFLAGTFLLMVLEPRDQIDFATAATASAATLNNIGPGLARVGAIENFGWFSDGSKLVMSLLMALGRLEVFAIIVLFNPRFWKED